MTGRDSYGSDGESGHEETGGDYGRVAPGGMPRVANLPSMLVTGGGGQLGRELARSAGQNAVALDRRGLDLTDPGSIAAALDRHEPEMVINAAAYTDVDGAESDESGARALNTDGVRDLAVACRDRGIRLVHVSTDYVYSGAVPGGGEPATAPGLEPSDATDPVTVYGRTKLEGERAALDAYPETTVVRTAWLYTGAWRVIRNDPGSDFVATMIRLESERDTISVVDDQWGSPTYVTGLAGGLIELASAERAGAVDARGRILHRAGCGRTTWYGLAREVFTLLGADPDRVRPCASDEFPRPAPRPAFSVLSDASWTGLGLSPMEDWTWDLGPGLEFLASQRDQI